MSTIASLVPSYFKSERKILVFGLDAAGKTTLFYKLRPASYQDNTAHFCSIGWYPEKMEIGNYKFISWDLGGQDRIAHLWKSFFPNTSALIFLIDCCDKERVEEAMQELYKMIRQEDLKHCPLLIYANKQDLKGSLTPYQIALKLGLKHPLLETKEATLLSCAIHGVPWRIQPLVAITGTGAEPGLQWLLSKIN
uniref:ADP-ribosylation factor n=1 Tax=Arcella intermedia TaxID=1963864 RepID=A0A6B2LJV1_9EUKA